MIAPKEDELWKDSRGNVYMPFIHDNKISFVGRFGNFFPFKNVAHGENGWERLYPEVGDE